MADSASNFTHNIHRRTYRRRAATQHPDGSLKGFTHGSPEPLPRVEDALHATRAAVEEGVVPGGGVALIRAKSAVENLKGANEGQNHGIQIALRAMEAPLREIVANAGE
jgi:hypothetical protein